MVEIEEIKTTDEVLHIFLDDLKEEAREDVLKFLNIGTDYDFASLPILSISKNALHNLKAL